MNFTGFFFYSVYNIFGRWDPSVDVGTIEPQDLAFSFHALFITAVTCTQCFIYPRGKNKVHLWCWVFTGVVWAAAALYVILQFSGAVSDIPDGAGSIDMLGYYKLVISLIKYMPQVWWNWYRKSTVGWSIFNIICDFTGGSFSFL